MKSIGNNLNVLMKSEKGNVIILVAFLMLFVLLGIAALTVDVGYLYTQKRHLQNTVDAAALAAAWELPWDDPNIIPIAIQYAGKHGINIESGTTIVVTRPFDDDLNSPDNSKVKVEITKNYPLFFARAQPIGKPDADVYAMAVATKEYTYVDLFPFLLLEYDDMFDEDDIDPWDSEWDDWETDQDAFYKLMKYVTPVPISLWVNVNAGNWGIADMRDFVDGMDTNGEINPTQDMAYILKHGLSESFCEGLGKQRKGKSGVNASIDNNVPTKIDGILLSERLERDDDFFVPMILPALAENFQGAHSYFGLEDFIIGHIIDLEIVGSGGNKYMVGTLIDVFYCPEIPDEYKKWVPVLIK